MTKNETMAAVLHFVWQSAVRAGKNTAQLEKAVADLHQVLTDRKPDYEAAVALRCITQKKLAAQKGEGHVFEEMQHIADTIIQKNKKRYKPIMINPKYL